MSILTQGTHVFVCAPKADVPGEFEVLRIKQCTMFNPGGSPADQIDDTDLDDTEAKRSRKGLRTPGSASLTLKADPREPSHIRLHELSEANDDLNYHWAIGWADGTAPPTLNVAGDGFELPADRTFCLFDAYVADFPFDFAGNTTVVTAATLQRSGPLRWSAKEEAPAP